ncbi:F-box protein SKIP22-like isoform X2 [Musa acuminata AAA Group]|uniref:F-box protein SKIP22-like isoform X2 n=1 Tax=Musa acuminata AAA Group TaxID=214697 RepID=UPI0031DE6758
MKLRIRSVASKETLRIQAPDPSSLHDLKTLIARALSSSSSISIPPGSIRLSLNRKDELLPSSPHDSLHSLGLTAGDLIFFSIVPDSQTLAPSPSSAPAPEETVESSNLAPVPPPETPSAVDDTPFGLSAQTLNFSSSSVAASVEIAESSNLSPVSTQNNPSAIASDLTSPQAEVVQQDDVMALDVEPVVVGKSLAVPCFLKRVIEAEKGEAEGLLGRLVITFHAAFLESGFVVSGGGGGRGSRFPGGCPSKAATFSVRYTLPELVGAVDGRDVKVAILRFSMMGNYATVYGFLNGDHQDVYRVCIDLSKLAPLLSLSMDSLSKQEEKEVFGLWKVVKDGLTLPLLIDICQKNGLPSPTCFMRLPTDLKIKILEFVSGIDVAKIGCTCSELRYLSSNDDLWKLRFLEEFGSVNERVLVGRSWKDKYVNYWVRRKEAEKMITERANLFRRPSVILRRFNPAGTLRLPVQGGDYDRFPAIGGFAPGVLGLGVPRLPARRNFSPDCNLGGNDAAFADCKCYAVILQ